jgi:hypothetical protein
MTAISCEGEDRRLRLLGQTDVVGLDYLDIAPNRTRLIVYFIGRAPRSLRDANCHEHFRIEGGERIRGIRVTGGRVIRRVNDPPRQDDDPWMDDEVHLTLDRAGDFSPYMLRLMGLPEPIDPIYDRLIFSFAIDCPSEADCRTREECPPPERPAPDISYLAKDYESFRQLIFDRLAVVMPDWTERHVPDVGVTLVELLAHVGDTLSYYQDAVATEAYLETARRRISVRRHARLVDYTLHEGCNARAWVCVEVDEGADVVTLKPEDAFFVTSLRKIAPNAGHVVARHDLEALPAGGFLVFEPLVADRAKAIELRPGHNDIFFYTWGQSECCLPQGATRATLLDQALQREGGKGCSGGVASSDYDGEWPDEVGDEPVRRLVLRCGDVLIFEEIVAPLTGAAADADPSRRHPVRLTAVRPAVDPLDGTLVLEIAWDEADALPFPLCLSSVTGPQHGCRPLPHVSVARGNVILVDHGERGEEEELEGEVPVGRIDAECHCPGHPGDVTHRPGRFEPRLPHGPLTWAAPVDLAGPAAIATASDPRQALPQLTLRSEPDGRSWQPHRDLIGSGPDNPDFVVEVDNEGRANIRFGNGECGMRPEARSRFKVRPRIGNGEPGNIGAGAIAHLGYRKLRPDAIRHVRNPMPATGGTKPEPMAEAKTIAPFAFRRDLERAITPDDYAAIAMRNPALQGAAAELRWTGSWYEVRVALDPLGHAALEPALAAEVSRDLHRYRRIGHDLSVVPAIYVPLDVEVEVCVRPDHLRGHVRSALAQALGAGTLPDGGHGFFHPDRLSFGKGVRKSRLVARAMAVEGVESVIVRRLQRLGEPPAGELASGTLPIGRMEIARCDNDPNFPEHGRLELVLLGGR